MADDLFAAVVKGDAARADEVGEVAAKAETVDVKALIKGATSVEHHARRVSVAAIWAVEEQREALMGAVQVRVDEQADALKRSDPTNLPVLTDEDVAAHRAAKIKAEA